jgi:hypothetical protein
VTYFIKDYDSPEDEAWEAGFIAGFNTAQEIVRRHLYSAKRLTRGGKATHYLQEILCELTGEARWPTPPSEGEKK